MDVRGAGELLLAASLPLYRAYSPLRPQFEGRPLTEQFNEKHENVKYLPGVKIAEGVVAEPSLLKACAGANALIFVTPHQFIPSICKQLHGKLPKGTRAISLVKGVDVHEDKIHIFSEVIEEHLGVSCAALSGANIANEVARDAFSETTIGCRNKEDGERWVNLFHTNHFRVSLTDDVLGVSLAGALKNVVAVAAGLVDGMQMGNNAKVRPFRRSTFRRSSLTRPSCTGGHYAHRPDGDEEV